MNVGSSLPIFCIISSQTPLLLLFLVIFIYLFIYLWLSWVFVAAHLLFSLVVVRGGYLPLRCVCSLQWLLLLQSTGSRHAVFSSCGSQALGRRLSSCGTRAYLLCSMWDLPGPVIEPMSPALAGGFLTTAPPGKSFFFFGFFYFKSFPLSITYKKLIALLCVFLVIFVVITLCSFYFHLYF